MIMFLILNYYDRYLLAALYHNRVIRHLIYFAQCVTPDIDIDKDVFSNRTLFPA